MTTKPQGAQVKYNAFPESKPTDVHLINTWKMHDINSADRMGLQRAVCCGPFTPQAERRRGHVDHLPHSGVNFGGCAGADSRLLRAGRGHYIVTNRDRAAISDAIDNLPTQTQLHF